MKPLKLVMEGFGSYREHTEIDFESLDRGLYLITGPTGSGKTTIFDAISFALYGSPSGSVRTGSALRNKNLDDSEECFVELEFMYSKKKYRIRRSPSYNKTARTGNVRLISATAELTLPDGEVITQVKRVDDYIVDEVMHLDRNQFSQISMLAQGEFQRMLLASTKDKMPIFRQIFKTSLYDTLTESIKADRKNLEDRRKVLNTKIDVECKRIPDVQMGEEVEEKLSIVRERHLSVADSIELLQEILAELQDEYEEKRKTFDILSSREIELTGEVKNLRDYNTLTESISMLETRLPDAAAEAEKAMAAFSEAEERNGEYKSSLILKESENRRRIETIQTLRKTRNQIVRDNEYLETRRTEFAKLESDKVLNEKSLAELEKAAASIPDRSDEKVSINSNILERRQELDSLDDAMVLSGKVEQDRRKDEKAKLEFKRAHEEYEKARSFYDEAYDIFYSQQAGILASSLEEGSPCPVCGSVHHPVLAELKDSNITDAELKRREVLKNEGSLKVSEAANMANLAAERLSVSEEVLDSTLRELGLERDGDISATLAERRNSIEKEMASLNEVLAEIGREALRRKETEERIQNLKGRIKDTLVRYDSLKGEISTFEGNLNARIEAYEAESEKLGEVDEMALLDETAAARREIQSIESDFQIASRNRSRCEAELQKMAATLESEKKRLEGIKVAETDENVLIETLNEVKVAKSDVNAVEMNIYRYISDFKSIIGNLGVNQKKFDEVDAEFGNLDMLYTTFMGHLTGSKKVGLETYVQMAYFDRILDRANKRLLKMTSGRYEMKRERIDEIDRNNSAKGLDVLIVDHYEGCDRAVQTLSGGEKFLSSLCLALGLSEEIESEAGGVHLDSIFIDEGFGSLDGESISLAMKALGDLAGGEKLVGIISHVDALKDRIDKKILVSRNMKGESKAQIII